MDLESLRLVLCRRYGWQLEAHGPDALERAIRQRMLWLEISRQEDYLQDLQSEGGEFSALLEELIVPESWFFREREALNQLTARIMQRHAKNPNTVFRILSAPCSRGEEPVSLVIQLLEAGLPSECLSIDAIDLSAVALEQARKGIYTNFSFRGDGLAFRDRTFEALPGGWRLKERYRVPITYQCYNVLELPHFFKSYDAIFCRNLLIYLTEVARMQLFQRFHQMLLPDGMLFLAASEFALPPNSLFSSESSRGALVFSRATVSYLADSSRAMPKSRPPMLPDLNPKPPLSRAIRPLPHLERRSVRLLSHDPNYLPAVAPRRTLSGSPPPDTTTPLPRLLDNAEQSANQGRFEEAFGICQQVLRREPSSRAYYLLALVNSARNQNDEAEANLRRALYLEPDNKDALGQLALCREKSGDLEGSRRLRERMKR